MAEKQTPEAKAVVDSVAKALDQLGPLATATLLEQQLADVRRVHHDGNFPKAMYGKDGQTRIVESKSEAEALGKGWSETPSDAHRASQNSGAVAEDQSRVEAETILRRAQFMADPANSSARSALHGSGAVVSSDTTMDFPQAAPPAPLTPAPAAAPPAPAPATVAVPAPAAAAPAPAPAAPPPVQGEKK